MSEVQDTLTASARSKCGVFGVVSRVGFSEEIGTVTYRGLGALQHRGQESAGISVSHGPRLLTHKAMGMIEKVFQPQVARHLDRNFHRTHGHLPDEEFDPLYEQFIEQNTYSPIRRLQGFASIGHNRYSTTGASMHENIHPVLFRFRGAEAALAHNGNVVNTEELRAIIESRGGSEILGGVTTDTVLIAALLETSSQPLFWDAFLETLPFLRGAFSLVVVCNDVLYAAKDEFGLRPLVLGENEEFYFVASETRALDVIEDVEGLGEVDPGIAVRISPHGIKETRWTDEAPAATPCRMHKTDDICGAYASCVFEDVYLSHPASIARDGVNVLTLQQTTGRLLAREHPLSDQRIDVVIAVPDSGNAAAIGCARELEKWHPELRYNQGIIRAHSGRSFIEPFKESRIARVLAKLAIVRDVVKDKNVVVVDDSLVRGITMPRVIKRLKRYGAKNIFVLIASPPLRHPCQLGVDMPTRDEFAAHNRTVEEVREEIGADFLGYLSVDALGQAHEECGYPADSFCYGCMTGEYPIPLIENGS